MDKNQSAKEFLKSKGIEDVRFDIDEGLPNTFDKPSLLLSDIIEEYASLPELTEILASEVRKQRPMYMNREDAIKVLRLIMLPCSSIFHENHCELEESYFLTIKGANQVIDALISAGHLTNHLPGKTNVLTDAEIEKEFEVVIYGGVGDDEKDKIARFFSVKSAKWARDEILKRNVPVMDRDQIMDSINDIQDKVAGMGFKGQNEYDLHLREGIADFILYGIPNLKTKSNE